MTNLVTFLVLFNTNTVCWTNDNFRGETITVDINHAIQYEVNGQLWWDTNYAVQTMQEEKVYQKCDSWQLIPNNILVLGESNKAVWQMNQVKKQ